MNKKLTKTLLFICLTMSQTVFSQSYELNVNEKTNNKVIPIQFIGEDSQGNLYVSARRIRLKMYLPLLVFNYANFKVEKYIKKYDKNLNLIEQHKVESENPLIRQKQIDGKIQLMSFTYLISVKQHNIDLPSFLLGDKFYMMSQESKAPHNSYSVLEVNKESGAVTRATNVLALSKNKKDKTLKVKDFKVSFSPDSNYLLFMATYQKNRSSKNGVAYSSAVFTKDMEPVFNSNYTLPKPSQKFTIKDAQLNNKGEVMILGRYFDKKQKTGYVSVYNINKDKLKPKESRLKFGGQKVDDALLSVNYGDHPLVMGFYKNRTTKKGYNGMFYAPLNENNEVAEVKKEEFDAAFISSDYTEHQTKKLAKKEKKGKQITEDKDFGFSEFIPTSDGGYLGIAENYYVVEVTTTTTSRSGGITTTKTKTEYRHHYDDLMVFKFDKEGKLQTKNKVAKRTTYVSAFSNKIYQRDYAALSVEGNIYLVFNDDPKATENNRKSDDRFNKDDATYIVSIQTNGELKKDVLVPSRKLGKYRFDPHQKLQIFDGNKVAFIATKNIRNKKTIMGSFIINKG